MRYTAEYLYGLLPEVYRVRDSENGGALAALLAVIAEQADLVEGDVGLGQGCRLLVAQVFQQQHELVSAKARRSIGLAQQGR